jgi:Flp pilus assembly protein protease CpaA
LDLIYLSSIWGGAVTILFLPILCILDLRTRSIPDKVLLVYAGIMIAPAIILYLSGLPLTYLAISIVVCIVWLIIRQTGAWGGGDTKFLLVFSLLCPLNPFNLYQQTFQISFVLILGAVMLMVAGVYWTRKDLPLMLPISAAIAMSLLIGVLL